MKKEKSKWLVALILCITCLALCVSMIALPTMAEEEGPLECGCDCAACILAAEGCDDGDNCEAGCDCACCVPGVVEPEPLECGCECAACITAGDCDDGDTCEAACECACCVPEGEPEPLECGCECAACITAGDCGDGDTCGAACECDCCAPEGPGGEEPGGEPIECGCACASCLAAGECDGVCDAECACDCHEPGGVDVLPGVITYRPTGTTGVFEVLVDGEPKVPPEYVYSAGNNPTVGAITTAIKLGDKFYVSYPYTGIYQVVQPGGTLSVVGGIWAGPDGVLGTADDLEINGVDVKFENGLFWLKSAIDGMWGLIPNLNIGNGNNIGNNNNNGDTNNGDTNNNTNNNNNNGSSNTTNPAGNSTGNGQNPTGNGGETSSTNPFFTGGGSSTFPDTGRKLNTWIMACIAVLFMGAIYCGYRLFRKEDESAAYITA